MQLLKMSVKKYPSTISITFKILHLLGLKDL